MVVHEASVKTTSYIAIGVLISVFSLMILMDVHKYFFMKSKLNRNIKIKRNNHQNLKIYRPYYTA